MRGSGASVLPGGSNLDGISSLGTSENSAEINPHQFSDNVPGERSDAASIKLKGAAPPGRGSTRHPQVGPEADVGHSSKTGQGGSKSSSVVAPEIDIRTDLHPNEHLPGRSHSLVPNLGDLLAEFSQEIING